MRLSLFGVLIALCFIGAQATVANVSGNYPDRANVDGWEVQVGIGIQWQFNTTLPSEHIANASINVTEASPYPGIDNTIFMQYIMNDQGNLQSTYMYPPNLYNNNWVIFRNGSRDYLDYYNPINFEFHIAYTENTPSEIHWDHVVADGWTIGVWTNKGIYCHGGRANGFPPGMKGKGPIGLKPNGQQYSFYQANCHDPNCYNDMAPTCWNVAAQLTGELWFRGFYPRAPDFIKNISTFVIGNDTYPAGTIGYIPGEYVMNSHYGELMPQPGPTPQIVYLCRNRDDTFPTYLQSVSNWGGPVQYTAKLRIEKDSGMFLTENTFGTEITCMQYSGFTDWKGYHNIFDPWIPPIPSWW